MIKFLKLYSILIFLLLIYILTRFSAFIFIFSFFIILRILSPRLYKICSEYWIFFIERLNQLIISIILSIIYLFVLTPIALLRRIVSNKKTGTNNSNFIECSKEYEVHDFENPW